MLPVASGELPGDERMGEQRASNAQHATRNLHVTLIDSPVANVANIARALRASGATLDVTREARTVARARKLVLPGVGSFAAAMQFLETTRLDTAIREAVANDAFLLGICVGHQLLFEVSREMGTTRGLGLLRGEVRRFDGPLPVPQIGWNRVHLSPANAPLFDGIADATPFYFVNSFAVRNAESEIASADYNGAFTAVAQQGRVHGVQFHPEKSSTAGLHVLRNFVQWN
jgi:glutamine amidotransferase